MILMQAPANNMVYASTPSGTVYRADDNAIIYIPTNSVPDQLALIAAGCVTLSPIGGGAARIIAGTTYVVQESDFGDSLLFTSNTAVTITLPNSLPLGFNFTARQMGTGVLNFVAAAGGSISSSTGQTSTNAQYETVGLEVVSNTAGTNAAWVIDVPSSQGSPWIGASTLAALYALDVANTYAKGTIGVVFNDTGTPANNGTWAKTGTGTGTGNWTQESTGSIASLSAAVTALAAQLAVVAAMNSVPVPRTVGGRGGWVIADKDGNVAFGIDDQGNIVSNNPAVGGVFHAPDSPRGFIKQIADVAGQAGFVMERMGGFLIPGTLQRDNASAYLFTTGGHKQAFCMRNSGAAVQVTFDAIDVLDAKVGREIGATFVNITSQRLFTVPYWWRVAYDGSGMMSPAPEYYGGVYEHTPTTGQSLSMGFDFSDLPVIRTTPLNRTYTMMFNTGDRCAGNNPPYGGNGYDGTLDGATLTSFIDLVEYEIPISGVGETPWRAYGDKLQQMTITKTRAFRRLLVSSHGVGGTGYAGLAKGQAPYTSVITGVTRGCALALAQPGGQYMVPCVPIVHGETDASNTGYGADLVQWQSDFNTDIPAAILAGYSAASRPAPTIPGILPILISQISSYTPGAPVINSPISNAQMLAAFLADPTRINLVCPKYFLVYSPADGIHLTPASSATLGNYYAKARAKIDPVTGACNWKPLYPTNVGRTGTTVTLTFNVPVGNCVIDTYNVTDPNGQKGFEYVDGSNNPVAITNVVASGNTVVFTLASGVAGRVRYAWTPPAGATGGGVAFDGVRGCLRDEDTEANIDTGAPLYNWCVHFDMPSP